MRTNGTGNGFPPSINDMRKAIDLLKQLDPAPQKELKMHPDDYEELKRQAAPHLNRPMQGAPNIFGGLLIVIDSTAKRMPKKARPAD